MESRIYRKLTIKKDSKMKESRITELKHVCDIMVSINKLNEEKKITIDKYIDIVNVMIPDFKYNIKNGFNEIKSKQSNMTDDDLKTIVARNLVTSWIINNTYLCKEYKEYEKNLKRNKTI
jgi:hypothetical protein